MFTPAILLRAALCTFILLCAVFVCARAAASGQIEQAQESAPYAAGEVITSL